MFENAKGDEARCWCSWRLLVSSPAITMKRGRSRTLDVADGQATNDGRRVETMQQFAWSARPSSIVSTALAVFLTLWGPHAAPGQEKEKKQPTKAEASLALAVGAEVVVKNSLISLDDNGRQLASWDQKSFWIDRIEGDRVQVSSRDKSKRGW